MKKRRDINADQTSLASHMHFAEAARIAIPTRLHRVYAHEAGARSGLDIEEVHDMRVASRRLRSAMTAFAPCFAKKRFKPLQRDATQLTQALGLVRDTDVMLEVLHILRARATEDEAAGIEDLIEVVQQARSTHRTNMIETFDALEHSGFRQRLEAAMSHASHSSKGDETLGDIAQRIGTKRIADLYGFVSSIHDPANVEQLHEMRKAAKRLRYMLELFHPCFGTEVQARIDDIKTLQEHIGQIHDCDVLIDLVRDRLSVNAQTQLDRLVALATQPMPEEQRVEKLREALSPGRNDPRPGLLGLLARTHEERQRRYAKFLIWWDARDAQGLRRDLYRCITRAATAV